MKFLKAFRRPYTLNSTKQEINMSRSKTNTNGINFNKLSSKMWASYFEEMGIRYKAVDKSFNLSDDLFEKPTFFLPKQGIWVYSQKTKIDPIIHESAKELCIMRQEPVLILDNIPTADYFAMIVYDSEWDYDVQLVNLLPVEGSFLIGHQLKRRNVYKEYGPIGRKAIQAIDNAINKFI